jgi:hypothetical protein
MCNLFHSILDIWKRKQIRCDLHGQLDKPVGEPRIKAHDLLDSVMVHDRQMYAISSRASRMPEQFTWPAQWPHDRPEVLDARSSSASAFLQVNSKTQRMARANRICARCAKGNPPVVQGGGIRR